MITGSQALNSIEEASAKVRADEMRLDAALRSASEEAARLRQERLKELRALGSNAGNSSANSTRPSGRSKSFWTASTMK
jgi:hypothetical protein